MRQGGRKIFNFLITGITFFSVFFVSANFAQASALDYTGLNFAADIGLGNVNPILILAKLIAVALEFLGIIALSLIIYAGFLWMTSGGNEDTINKAKQTLKNAVIGLLIIFSAFALVSFFIGQLLGQGSGEGGDDYGNNFSSGIGSLGNGIIQTVYPVPNQKEVPRNTSVIVTFREAMQPNTICNAPAGATRCMGEAMTSSSVKIFKSSETSCGSDQGACSSFSSAKVFSTVDNKTFVFVPDQWLGSPSEYIWYRSFLSNKIRKADGYPAFQTAGGQHFQWDFEVSNKVDLDPPQVLEGGIFPGPDQARDTVGNEAVGVAASGTLIVLGRPNVNSIATATNINPQGPSPIVNISLSPDCPEEGAVTVTILPGSNTVATATKIVDGLPIPLGKGNLDGEERYYLFDFCSFRVSLTTSTDRFSSGNQWTMTFRKKVEADSITVGNIDYTFYASTTNDNDRRLIAVSAINVNTAENINLAINASNANAMSTRNDNVVMVRARRAEAVGNQIALYSSNKDIIDHPDSRLLAGGKDRSVTTIVKSRKDKPMNAAIQFNFNEAVNPVTLSGSSTAVSSTVKVINVFGRAGNNEPCATSSDCFSYKCGAGRCIDNSLAGTFALSNEFKTVEFISDNKCGVNACGQPIYCLPANSNLAVVLNASPLKTCTGNEECASLPPYNRCQNNVCYDTFTKKNFPTSDPLVFIAQGLGGITDLAFNSLDGNRDTNATGTNEFDFNENDLIGECMSGTNAGKFCSYLTATATCGTVDNCSAGKLNEAQAKGDDYRWSFFVSDKIDLSSPVINRTGYGTNLLDPLQIDFSLFMLSSSLNTGGISTIVDGKTVKHKLLNLWGFTSAPIGYWSSNENLDDDLDGEYDRTNAFINHTDFSESANYRAQAGSGVKTIYQNCYKPCAGPACTGANQVDRFNASCCSGVRSNATGFDNNMCPGSQ